MDCDELLFSVHAIRRMHARAISFELVAFVVAAGETVEDYPEDEPYPSCLLLGATTDGVLHVVVARDPETRRCVVVTVYWPDEAVWQDGFKVRRER